MTLDHEDIEQIARRVTELIGSSHAPRYVDATDLAQILGVDREWVYEHARRLGAIRLGGPSGRLRFDVRQVTEALAGPDSTARPMRRTSRTSSRQRGSRADKTGVIQYER
jgi:hypothetical protein